jgi:amino acid permease
MKASVIVSAILGVVLLVVGYIYFTHSANTLPSFFPGYSATLTKVHIKHGIGAIVVAIGAFIYAWFQSGAKENV